MFVRKGFSFLGQNKNPAIPVLVFFCFFVCFVFFTKNRHVFKIQLKHETHNCVVNYISDVLASSCTDKNMQTN